MGTGASSPKTPSPTTVTTTTTTDSAPSSVRTNDSNISEGTKNRPGRNDGLTDDQIEIIKLREQVAALEADREISRKELAIIYDLDDVRDDTCEPLIMFENIVEVIVDYFSADMVFLYLFDRESDELELWGAHPKGTPIVQPRIKDSKPVFTYIDDKQNQCDNDATSITEEVRIYKLKHLPPMLTKPGIDVASLPGHCAAISIIMHDKQMGLMLIGRPFAFTDFDVRLLKAAESQIDSAVVQAHNNIDFMLSNKELEVIYRVDHLRDANHSLETLLENCVAELSDVIGADATFVMLYKVLESKLVLQAASTAVLWEEPYTSYLQVIGDEALKATKLVWHNKEAHELEGQALQIRAGMCVPLILQNQIIGVFGALNEQKANPFLLAHRRLLKAVASQLDTAIYDSLESFRLRQVLGRSVDRKVLERLLLNPNVEVLKPERTVCTVLFADIRGSTNLAEILSAEVLGRYINDFLSEMSKVIVSFEGTLDKFIGDEVMAIFNAPFPQPDHALRAIQVGLAMQRAHKELQIKWKKHNITNPIGIGIATGELIAGEYGCSLRTDYTVIGRAANLAARITSIAPAGAVLCSTETYNTVKDQIVAVPSEHDFKGIGHAVVYNVSYAKSECLIEGSLPNVK